MTPQELQSHASKVGLRLEIISRKYDRFGWDQISDEVRTLLRADWTAALLNYSLDEIDAAITEYVNDTKNRKAAHEGQIKAIIVVNRQRVAASMPKYVKPEPERIQATAEQRQAIMDEVNFSGDVKVRKFTDKPEERE